MTALPPDPVRTGIEAALEASFGRSVDVTDARRLGGGCISPAARVATSEGDFFVKWDEEGTTLFGAEADGLRALREAADDEIRVPEVVAVGEGEGPSWLLLEFVAEGAGGRDYPRRLGRGLAHLHRHRCEGHWGWERNNLIGSLPQENRPLPRWSDFWARRRLEPQVRRAVDAGALTGRRAGVLEEVVERTHEALDEVDDGPSLLHGDLWGGNVFPDGSGTPVLIDPAVYRGHREVDLAMSELFGFPSGFLPAYREAWAVDEGYAQVRRPLYQLYYLLVHVNLFGAGYVAGTLRAAETVLARLG